MAKLAYAQDLKSCTGAAQVAANTGLTKPSPDDGTQAGQTGSIPTLADDDLRAVVEAWDTLPAAVRAGIVAMVKASGG